MIRIFPLIFMLFLISCNKLKKCDGVEVIEGIVYKDGEVYTSKCAFYDDINGKMISSHEYLNGKFHGQWIFYYTNGELETKGRFDNGLRIGEWKYFHENGNLKQISVYDNGKKNGIWRSYDIDGNINGEQEWKNDLAIIDSSKVKSSIEIKIPGYDVKPIQID
tara:strand:- start:2049 stop:2537 length:489 start_codon:yes stop_codon:yes gene_type:complete